ncbi:RNA 2',3'-cyclic phosphodiesterase [Actinomycetes bacterium KLBMP 9797]
MRLFVAVYPPDDVVHDLAARVAELHVGRAAAEGINTRLAPRDHWHVTLAFLGEVADARLSNVVGALGEAVAPAAPFEVRLAGGGRFGAILWVGVGGDLPALTRLSRLARRGLSGARIRYDRKRFQPHLTIARPGDRLDRQLVAADRAALDRYEGPPWRVAEVVLMRSHPGPKPRYDRLAAFPLS